MGMPQVGLEFKKCDDADCLNENFGFSMANRQMSIALDKTKNSALVRGNYHGSG